MVYVSTLSVAQIRYTALKSRTCSELWRIWEEANLDLIWGKVKNVKLSQRLIY
jgi:hypothetical protein